MLQLKLFGEFNLTDESSVAIVTTSRKDAALLSYLVLQDRPVDRSVLTHLLWPDRAEEQARKSLRQSLVALRRLLNRERELLPADGAERISLDHARMGVDVHDFEALATKGCAAAATKLYAGPLLESFSSPTASYDIWLGVERARLAELASGVLAGLSEDHLASSDWEQAVSIARRLVETDPLREAGHRLLMRGLDGAGRRNQALQQFHHLRDLLREDLDVSPDAETSALYRSIRKPTAVATPAVSSTVESARASALLPLPGKPSIAVLSFENMSGDPEHEFFTDGISEDIITALSHFHQFFVIARNSSFTYKSRAVDVKQVARELGVQYILKGSVRRAGNRVRVAAQLIDAASDHQVWAEHYDRQIGDIFAIQDEITQCICGVLEGALSLAEQRRARLRPLDKPDAWSAYHLGVHCMNEARYVTVSTDAVKPYAKARSYFKHAHDLDPNFARPLSTHALVLRFEIVQGIRFGAAATAAIEQGIDLCDRGIAIDPLDGVHRVVRGTLVGMRGDWNSALQDIEAGIELNPNSAFAYHQRGVVNAYGEWPENAIDDLEMAARLSPLDPILSSRHAIGSWAQFRLGQYEGAATWAERGIVEMPSLFWPAIDAAAAHVAMNQMDRASEWVGEAIKRRPDLSTSFMRDRMEYLADTNSKELFLDCLTKAGLPD
jgi:TolB-like protein